MLSWSAKRRRRGAAEGTSEQAAVGISSARARRSQARSTVIRRSATCRAPGRAVSEIHAPEHDAVKAEEYFERALSVARQQQAKSWELRASMSLARLWRDQGKPQQTRGLLAPVCGWFTEGFDTRDLKEAKALLDALA